VPTWAEFKYEALRASLHTRRPDSLTHTQNRTKESIELILHFSRWTWKRRCDRI